MALSVVRTVMLPLLAAVLVPGLSAQTRLPPIDRFLMDRTEEVALARSAGPGDVGTNASIMVLTAAGYEKAVEGRNGFVCFVGRGWSGPVIRVRNGTKVVSPDATDPKVKAPHCFNSAAASSILQWHMFNTRALIGGATFEDLEGIDAQAVQSGELETPKAGAMAYMTSSRQYLGDNVENWRPHLMFYLPYAETTLFGNPGTLANGFPFIVEAGTTWAIGIVPIGVFSDGSTPTWQPLARGN